MRIIVPPITNEAVTTLKNTSLLSTITVVELTLQAQIVIAATYRPFDFYITAAVLYLAMTHAVHPALDLGRAALSRAVLSRCRSATSSRALSGPRARSRP